MHTIKLHLISEANGSKDGSQLLVSESNFTLCAEDHVPCLAGRVVAGDLGVEEACPEVGLLGLVLVGDDTLVVLLGDLRYLGRSFGGYLGSNGDQLLPGIGCGDASRVQACLPEFIIKDMTHATRDKGFTTRPHLVEAGPLESSRRDGRGLAEG